MMNETYIAIYLNPFRSYFCTKFSMDHLYDKHTEYLVLGEGSFLKLYSAKQKSCLVIEKVFNVSRIHRFKGSLLPYIVV